MEIASRDQGFADILNRMTTSPRLATARLAAVGTAGLGLLTLAALRWGRKQAWIVGVPIVLFFAFGVADAASRLLPNLT